MVFNDRPLKRAKKIATSDLHDFLTFPADSDHDYHSGDFRSNVQRFLRKHAYCTCTPSIFPRVLSWQIQFRIGDPPAGGTDWFPPLVTLDIVEEDVAKSRSVYCDQCRVIGWSNHPVCAKRYHYIIPAGNPSEEYLKPCSKCGNLLRLIDSRCKFCCIEMTADDLEEWVDHQLEDTSHLLHGVIHSNGYGHLLRINGREGGSKILSGCDIMSFWDRLCTTIAARQISVMDVSKKYGLEYRLLHTIMKGHPWYGDWGYVFGSGSYALTRESYQKAVNSLSTLPLSSFLFQSRRPRSQLQEIIAFYQSLSDFELLTLKDLFSFLIKLINENHVSSHPKDAHRSKGCVTNVLCAWTRNEVERAQRDILKVLSAATSDSDWVTRRSLKGALCKSSSLNLLDYSLKHLPGVVGANGKVVRTRCNLISTAVEFRLDFKDLNAEHCWGSNHPSESQILEHLKILYDSIVNPQTMGSYKPEATRKAVMDSSSKLLDCKKFIKNYTRASRKDIPITNPAIHLWCEMELCKDKATEIGPMPPSEVISLPSGATMGELKREASRVFSEVYPVFRRFEAKEIAGYERVEDSMKVMSSIRQRGWVRVRGSGACLVGLRRFRMERGVERWAVRCVCGARDDDGEKMLACDVCGIWMHTRCVGIVDTLEVHFLCAGCSSGSRGGFARKDGRHCAK